MATWWLAIDTKYSSYNELKHRKVAAQGWRKLSDLSTLIRFVSSGNSAEFIGIVDKLEEFEYGGKSHAGRVMWDMLNIRQGDLIVGIEGTLVKGICQLNENGWESYRCLLPEAYEYAQTIGFPIVWEDWTTSKFGFTPVPPAHSVQGIAALKKESIKVQDAWNKLKGIKP